MSDDLTQRYYAALREPNLIIQLGRNLLGGGAPLLRLFKPGPTDRAKPVQLVPTIIGDQGESHADMLRQLADAMDQA